MGAEEAYLLLGDAEVTVSPLVHCLPARYVHIVQQQETVRGAEDANLLGDAGATTSPLCIACLHAMFAWCNIKTLWGLRRPTSCLVTPKRRKSHCTPWPCSVHCVSCNVWLLMLWVYEARRKGAETQGDFHSLLHHHCSLLGDAKVTTSPLVSVAPAL